MQQRQPTFTITPRAIGMIADISARIERYAIRLEQQDALRLRKVNKIKTIHSSPSGAVTGGVNGGVNAVLEYIRQNPGERTNAIATALGIPLRTVQRHHFHG